MRRFAPLCPAEWSSTILRYVSNYLPIIGYEILEKGLFFTVTFLRTPILQISPNLLGPAVDKGGLAY
jgi:hypothetical protein